MTPVDIFFPKTIHQQGQKGKKLFERNYFHVVRWLFCQKTDPGMFHEAKEIGLIFKVKPLSILKRQPKMILTLRGL